MQAHLSSKSGTAQVPLRSTCGYEMFVLLVITTFITIREFRKGKIKTNGKRILMISIKYAMFEIVACLFKLLFT